MRGDENIGMEIAESEVEETVEEGSAAVEDETSKEDEEETDEEEKEEEPDRLSELEILPGKTAYINFYYTIDPEIEGMKDQDIKFVFEWMQENKDGKEEKHRKEEVFEYAVDALNLLTVTTGGEKGWVEVGKEDEMLLEFDLGQMREILDEAVEEELEKHEDDDASASEARRASASEILVGWDEENGSRPLGKKDPAVIKKLKCEVETFGLKLNKFKAVPVTDDDNYGTSLKCDFLVSRNNLPGTYYGRVKASYEIKNRTFHTTQAFKVVVKQETGEIELTGKIGDSEIIMSGPASSFPRAEELSLKVSEVTQEQQEKVDEALQKKAEEGTEINQYKALDIKLIADGEETEPEGDVQVRFKNVELENPEEKKEAEQEKAEEQSIVKKAVRKVMSLFGVRDDEEEKVEAVAENEAEAETETKEFEEVKAEGSEEAAGMDEEKKEEDEEKEESTGTEETAEANENIKVLHLDEDAVIANEMKSEVQDNGDVVMDTDHFSIYIVVQIDGNGDLETIPLEIQHWATFNKFKLEGVRWKDGTRTVIPVEKKTGDDGKVYYKEIGGSNQIIKTEQIDSGEWLIRYAEDESISRKKGDKLLQGLNRETNTYDQETKELYAPDHMDLKRRTGYKYSNLIQEFSKVSSGGNYKVVGVSIWDPNKENEKGEKGDWSEIKTGKEEKKDENGNVVKDDTGNPILEDIDEEIYLNTSGNKIRIYYEPTKAIEVKGEVSFHDYNVSIKAKGQQNVDKPWRSDYTKNGDGIFTTSPDYSKVGYRTNNVGINNLKLWMDDDGNLKHDTEKFGNERIGVGISAYSEGGDESKREPGNASATPKDIAHIYHYHRDFLRGGTRLVAKGLIAPEELTEVSTGDSEEDISYEIKLKTGVFDPGLFYPDDIITTENCYESDSNPNKTVDYYAKKYLTDYELGFQRTGDTYVLENVYKKGNATPVLSNLSEIKRSYSKGKTQLFSNLFWPLDNLNYGISGETMDPMFGVDYGFNPNDEQTGDDPLYPLASLKSSSDGMVQNTVKHNWYFGMRYDFNFTVGDYTGPMDYYFRGDDDFWLYIDGVLVKDVDLGGIHNARGAYVDMRDWMERNKTQLKNDNGLNTNHTMTVFFMERGGTGSCCYMSFTLPNARPKPTPGTATTKVIVKKEWKDNEPTNTHPSIKVQLYRSKENPGNSDKWDDKYEAYGSPMTLDSSNNWTYEWTDLIKFKKNGEPFEYRIKEDTKVVDYLARYDNSSNGTTKTFTITNVSSIKIPVEKTWENDGDGTGKRPKEIEVQLYRQLDGEEEEVVPINEKNKNESGRIKLTAENEWKFTWELPLYVKKNGNWKKVTYTKVKEVDGEWLYNSSGWYKATVTGDENQGFTITNTFEDKFLVNVPITKECIDLGNGNEIFDFEVKQIKVEKGNDDNINAYEYEPENIGLPSMPIKINVDKDNNPKKQDFILEYNVNDFHELSMPCSLYYEIKEKPGNGNFIYDTSTYIAEVIISKDSNGKLRAEVGDVWKSNPKVGEDDFIEFSKVGKDDFIKFTNRKIVKLKITKDVEDGGNKNFEFSFTANIKPTTSTGGTESFTLPDSNISNLWYSTEGNSLDSFQFVKLNDDGSIDVSFNLKHNEKVIIPVPIRSTVKITENNAAGYYVKFSVNGKEKPDGNVVEISDIASDGNTVNVTCTNKPGVVLPDTGGPGLLMMSRLGWMLLLLALLMAGMEIQFYGERRNRKAATVQREDTRGFDPDDY